MAEPNRVSERPALRFWRNHRVKLCVSLLIAGAFAWTLRRGGLPLVPSREALVRVSIPLCAAYVVLLITWTAVRAARWRHLLYPVDPDIPLRRIVAVSYISFAAILIMPLRAGEVVRPYMIRQRSRVSFAAATGTVGAERVIDGLALTLLLGVCMQIAHPLDPLPDHIGKLPIPVVTVPFYAYLALAGFVLAFILMSLFCWRPAIGRALVERTLGIVSRRAAAKISDFVATTAEGLKFLPSLRHLIPFLLETVLYWGLNGVSMWVLALACGIDSITLTQAFVIMGVLGVGILVPAGPGLFGAFQASTYAGMAMYFHDDVVLGAGAAFVFILYVLQWIWLLLATAVFLGVERGAAREALQAESS
jgi:glycosyltransferase 2 family protein